MWQLEQYLPMMSDTTLVCSGHLRTATPRSQLPHVAEHRPRLSFAHPASRRIARSGRDDFGIARVRDDPLGVAADPDVLEHAGRPARGVTRETALVPDEGLTRQWQRPPDRRVGVCGRVFVPRYVSTTIPRPMTPKPAVTSGRFRKCLSGRRSRNGSRNSKSHHQRGNHHRRQRLERTGEVFQQLKEAEEVPLGTRHVRGVRWIGDWIERRAEHDREREQQRANTSAPASVSFNA